MPAHDAARTRREHCPECDPDRKKSKSLAITVDTRGEVRFCHRCGDRGARGADTRFAAPVQRLKPRPNLDAIWARTLPLRGSLGEIYLEYRSCAQPPADSDLRYLPASERYPNSSLCALVTNAVTGERMSLHFTRLAHDGCGKAGTDCDKRLLGDHAKAGGVIRLWPNEAVTQGLGVAEGIESALSAAHAYRPMWATVDAGNMAKFPVLNGIETLMVFADNDAAGLAAARACGSRWAAAGREARLVVPDRGDVNDAVAS